MISIAERSDSDTIAIFSANIFARSVAILERGMKLFRPHMGHLPEEKEAYVPGEEDDTSEVAARAKEDPGLERERGG